MRLEILSLFAVAICAATGGCATSRSVNGPGDFGFLAKGGSCHGLAEDAGTAAAIAVDLQRAPPPSDGKRIEAWRMLAFATHEPLQARGWSKEEIFSFAKELVAATSKVDKVTAILTADLYFETACDLLRKDQGVQPYSLVSTKLTSCLHRADRREGLQCASGVIR